MNARWDYAGPWLARTPWLRGAEQRETADFAAFANEVSAVVKELAGISDSDVERVRVRLEQDLPGPTRNPMESATLIGMAIGYVLARQRFG